ncbi:MAG: TIGR04282 family arsenosugar biosynthesis glycosyltransferase [Bacteroidota bacterium]
MKHPDHALLIFIKNAKKGQVKTRLAASVGEDKALKIYQALMKHTREVALAVAAQRLLFYSQEIVEDEWSPNHFQKTIQQGPDLGARMEVAFQQALSKYSKAIIIGSDCASLTPAIIASAFDLLDQHPFVIGPALDGGYYLLGMRQMEQDLFRAMPWSTEKVLEETKRRIRE